jgi:hypothetical protein
MLFCSVKGVTPIPTKQTTVLIRSLNQNSPHLFRFLPLDPKMLVIEFYKIQTHTVNF